MHDQSNARSVLFTMGVLGGSLVLVGCPKQPEVGQGTPAAMRPAAVKPSVAQTAPRTQETRVTQATPTAETTLRPSDAASPATASPFLKDVFFDYDTALIREDQKPVLRDDFIWLREHPQAKVTIEGNCDERGTVEYNLALGDRRAKVVKEYLVAAGIPAQRIATISYGKERPFVLGHDENAWRMNRRDHLVAAR
jgi:peptidoglycan-associated lipoprotein